MIHNWDRCLQVPLDKGVCKYFLSFLQRNVPNYILVERKQPGL
jgi:hypothetical protein